MTNFEDIYRPIKDELVQVNAIVERSLRGTSNKFILELNRYLLESPGKRIRPMLVILSARASRAERKETPEQEGVIALGAAVELIHMASLIHDDTIDHAHLRHSRPSINSKWGNEVSIAMGDYLYSKAFELLAVCENSEVLACLSQAMVAMCEGELTQVKERNNLGLDKRRYLVIVKQKTASLMASCCRAGAASARGRLIYKQALTDYGFNFGIAFQLMDDYLDLTSTDEVLGKPAGLDLTVGELTLPVLSLPESVRKKILAMKNKNTKEGIELIKRTLERSGALASTRRFIDGYIMKAKGCLGPCRDSEYRDSLSGLVDFIKWKKQAL